MIDSHCHLDLPSFDNDLIAVLSRAREAGVKRILIPGTTCTGWQQQAKLCTSQFAFKCNPALDVAFGLHPYFLGQANDNNAVSSAATDSNSLFCTTSNTARAKVLAILEQLLSDPVLQPVAVGEIGLDAVIDVDCNTQTEMFKRQLQLASDAKLPVILHHRKTHHLLLKYLKQQKFKQGGVVHAFSGSIEVAKEYIALGFMLGVGGTITYPRAKKTRDTIQQIALEHVLLETDSPDMPICGKQGQRNEPSNLTHILQALSELKQISPESVCHITELNYSRLFLGV